MMDAPQNAAPSTTNGWIYVVSVNRQLHKIQITHGESNVAVVERLQNTHLGERGKLPFSYRLWRDTFFMRKIVIGWVDLKRAFEPEAQTLKLVHSGQIVRDDFLTSAFFETRTLPASTSVASYLLEEKANTKHRTACLGYTEIDRRMAAVWLLIALVLSTFAGVAIGAGWRNANLGFDVGTCMLAVLSASQGILLLW